MYYTGIGSRQTPLEWKPCIKFLSHLCESKGLILRSGGASGSDLFFEEGVTKKEIYLRWKGFNNNSSDLFTISEEAYDIAKEYHPNWYALSNGSKKLMARNTYQLLGKDLKTLSDFVICWTPGGRLSGGTSQVLRMCSKYGIKVFNLGQSNKVYYDCIDFINSNY